MNPIEQYSRLTKDMLADQGTNLAFFKGPLQPDLVIIGEAPGPDENSTGTPFIGTSGALLRGSIESCGLDIYKIAYLNSVFRMPVDSDGHFRKPTSEEIDHYRPMVEHILHFLSPTCILLLGNAACEAVLRQSGVTKLRGLWFGNTLPTFHPSFVLRNENARGQFEKDIRLVASKLLGLKLPLLKTQNNPSHNTYPMSESEKIKEIAKKSKKFGNDLESIRSYLTNDPPTSIIRARKLLEELLDDWLMAEKPASDSHNLSEKISDVSFTFSVPRTLVSFMHLVRTIGNTAVHSNEQIDTDSAKQVFEALLRVFCWRYQIEANKNESAVINESNSTELSSAKVSKYSGDAEGIPFENIGARFFVADEVHRTWPKIAVLTEDGTLYSEYLAWMKPTSFKKTGLNFISFTSDDFSFGADEHGNAYQSLREVTYEEAVSFKLVRQENWVNSYLARVVRNISQKR